jgi:hypothetical protein
MKVLKINPFMMLFVCLAFSVFGYVINDTFVTNGKISKLEFAVSDGDSISCYLKSQITELKQSVCNHDLREFKKERVLFLWEPLYFWECKECGFSEYIEQEEWIKLGRRQAEKELIDNWGNK